jgi:hypothetical protein
MTFFGGVFFFKAKEAPFPIWAIIDVARHWRLMRFSYFSLGYVLLFCICWYFGR